MQNNDVIINKKYRVERQIGQGNFGKVFVGRSLKPDLVLVPCTALEAQPVLDGQQNPKDFVLNGQPLVFEKVAIKFESIDTPFKLLKHETTILKYLDERGCKSIPIIHWYGRTLVSMCLVMTFFECSLNDYLQTIDGNKLNEIMQQCIDVLESIHDCAVIHRDIKPQNFMVKAGKIYLIDFGFSLFYTNGTTHITGMRDTLVGSPRFCSYYVHLGCPSSRRDDLISLGYMYLMFQEQDKTLVWDVNFSNIENNDNIMINSLINQHRRERKSWNYLEEYVLHCKPLWNYLNYCYSLKYDEEPNYSLLRNLWE